jgi:membrane dipeptidase
VQIVDAHNDLLLELVLLPDEPNPFRSRWLPKLDAGSVGVQVCPIYVAETAPDEARARALAQADAFARAVRENEDRVVQVRGRRDLEDERIGLMLSLEGAEALKGDPAAFDEWWELGVRMISLTWNHPNAFAGGIGAPEQGLTDAGEALVDRLAERGAVLDLAHASEPTFWEALEQAPEAAVVVSHAGCRAVNDLPRNLSDAQLEALAGRDGVLGVMAIGAIVDRERPTIDRFVDHVEHAVAVMGVDHVGIGADFIDQVQEAERAAGLPPPDVLAQARVADGGRSFGLDGFTGPEHFGRLVATLQARGFAGEQLSAILGENFLRLFRAALLPS